MKRLIPGATALMVVAVFSVLPESVTAGPAGAPAAARRHAEAALVVRLGLRDGTSRLVTLDGVGCFDAICSRVAVNSRIVRCGVVNRARFDTISALKEINDSEALFVFKDGTTRRASVVPNNRVLYVIDADGRTQKLALREIRSLEFVQ